MKKLLALGLLLSFAPLASATVTLINDDFQSYGDDTALGAVWPIGVGTTATTYLDLDPTDALNQVVHQEDSSVGSGRRDQSFAPTTLQSWQEIVWQFDFYDFAGNTTGPRQYGQILAGSGGLSELIAMGQYNAATNHDNNKYQARVAFGGPNWFNLNTDRSVGWHTFKAVINPTTVDFYVDGVLDTAGVPQGGTDWYQARIGSGLSATADALFDNYSVVVSPEPASLALLVLGGVVALRRRR
jgi:hypothetical protein